MKKIFTLMLSMAMVAGAQAQTVSPEAAAQKAASLFTNANAAKGLKASTVNPKLAFTSTLDGTTCFYVFDNPQGGYAIIGGDAVSREVLAVIDNGSFDFNALPAPAQGMLNQYAKQISAAKKAGLSAPVVTAQPEGIQPFCPATWGQDEPYHNFTPTLPNLTYFQNYQGTNYVGKHAATGCVATAAAQALYTLYKNAKTMPAHITEDISKKLNFCSEEDDELGQTETLTYSKTRKIEWSILKDNYTEDGTDASSVEVGQLMYLMGLISDMGYGISSGADTKKLQAGLQKYLAMTDAKYLAKFGDDGKQKVDDNTWETTVYSELEEKRPVIFTGNDKNGKGGHCFLCDGYRKGDNLFHINWGWNSTGDGYFALCAASQTNSSQGEGSVLRPQTGDTQTGGSSTDDYGYGNEIVYNLIYKGNDPYSSTTTAINTVNAQDITVAPATKKVMKNGRFIIVKDGKKFNAAGQQM